MTHHALLAVTSSTMGGPAVGILKPPPSTTTISNEIAYHSSTNSFVTSFLPPWRSNHKNHPQQRRQRFVAPVAFSGACFPLPATTTGWYNPLQLYNPFFSGNMSPNKESPQELYARSSSNNNNEENNNKKKKMNGKGEIGTVEETSSNVVIRLVEGLGRIVTLPTPGIMPVLPLGYTIVLIVAIIILPVTTSVLFVTFFVMYSYTGRRLILDDYYEDVQEDDQEYKAIDGSFYNHDDDDDDDDPAPNTDLLALGGAIVSAGILAPYDNHSTMTAAAVVVDNLWGLFAIPIAGLIWISLWSSSNGGGSGGSGGDDKDEDTELILESSPPSSPSLQSPEEKLMSLWDQNLIRNTKVEEDDEEDEDE